MDKVQKHNSFNHTIDVFIDHRKAHILLTSMGSIWKYKFQPGES